MNCEFCFCQKDKCVCRKGMWDKPVLIDPCLTDECGCSDCECPPGLDCTCKPDRKLDACCGMIEATDRYCDGTGEQCPDSYPWPPTFNRGILESALTVVAERGEDYDHPLPNHERIAALWSVILEQDVTPLQVVNCMIAVKLARLVKTPDHRDSLVDIAGYADCAGAILDARRG